MSKIRCPSEDWDTYVEGQERAEFPNDEEILKSLDAYGHLTYCVGYSDEWEEEDRGRGDWLACFDFTVFKDPDDKVMVAYQVVVNSDTGGFIMGMDEGICPADEAPYDLVDYWISVGMDDGTEWLPHEIRDAEATVVRWCKDLKDLIEYEKSTVEA